MSATLPTAVIFTAIPVFGSEFGNLGKEMQSAYLLPTQLCNAWLGGEVERVTNKAKRAHAAIRPISSPPPSIPVVGWRRDDAVSIKR